MPYHARVSLSARYRPLFRVEPSPPEYFKQFGKENSGRVPVSFDLQLPDTAFPYRAYEQKGFKQLPDIIPCEAWYAVSQEFRDIVELLDPDIHQFSAPLSVFYKDGRKSEKTYYCINPRHYLDNTIIKEKSPGIVRWGGRLEPRARENDLLLDANIIGERHFWRARDFYLAWFFSDEMAERVVSAKIRKFDLTHHPAGWR